MINIRSRWCFLPHRWQIANTHIIHSLLNRQKGPVSLLCQTPITALGAPRLAPLRLLMTPPGYCPRCPSRRCAQRSLHATAVCTRSIPAANQGSFVLGKHTKQETARTLLRLGGAGMHTCGAGIWRHAEGQQRCLGHVLRLDHHFCITTGPAGAHTVGLEGFPASVQGPVRGLEKGQNQAR